MKSFRNFSMMAMVVVALIFAGCAKVPQAEIDAAVAAIDSVKMAGADSYVPEAFGALQDSMKVVMEMVEEQKAKTFGNYGEVKTMLASIMASTVEVKAQAETRKMEIIQEVQTAVTDIQTMVGENVTLALQAPKGKEGTAALEAIKAENQAIADGLANITAALEGGDVLGAQAMVNEAKEKAMAINTELKDVIAKYTGKK